ncbi:Hypothetical predicted protein [Paramuricea clavata]|uniref:Uncharacterized protein n=1 Tax=Paramuricea clavata TaxID=317549 RepID=A0A6S7IHY7_PARCT|nr:Hypothetical predicted protein [Paramuricea clavata]
MLYVANNGETCKDQLCQHPECWQSNIRRVREAVRQRNGIRQEQNVNKQSAERFDDKKRQVMESCSLPTLKIIDMTEDLVTPYNSSDQVHVFDNEVEKDKQLHSSMPHQSTRAQASHTTPISPSLPERHASRWKEKLDSFNENSVDEKMTKINFHEIYDYNEVCQDWQDMFISTAYLVWCPSKKKRRKRETRSSSAVSENKNGFKSPIEVSMLPLPPESSRKVKI